MAEMPLINIEFNGPTKIEIYQMLGPHPMLPIVMDIAPWDMMDEPDMLVGGTPLHPRYPASGYHSDPYHEGGDWTSPSPSSTEMPRRRGQGNRQGQGTRRKGRTTPGPSGRPTSSPGPSDRPSSSPYPNDRSDPSYGIHDDTMPYGDYDMDGSTTEPTDEMPRRKGQGNRQGNRQREGTAEQPLVLVVVLRVLPVLVIDLVVLRIRMIVVTLLMVSMMIQCHTVIMIWMAQQPNQLMRCQEEKDKVIDKEIDKDKEREGKAEQPLVLVVVLVVLRIRMIVVTLLMVSMMIQCHTVI